MSLEIDALNPSTVWQVPETFRAVYTHAMRVKHGTEMLFVSGQFGVRPDGTLPADFAAQAEQALANVEALLAAAGMGLDNVVKLTYLLTRADDAPELVKLRARKWAGRQAPAVTVVTVVALAKPEYLVEIEATAVA
jgi:enamine deaminase RidA (YjgF/YER057c/UK114 family)